MTSSAITYWTFFSENSYFIGEDTEKEKIVVKNDTKAQQRGVQHSLESQKDSGRLIY